MSRFSVTVLSMLATICQMSVEISSQNDSLCVAPSTSQPPSPAPPPPPFPDFLSIFAQTFQNNIMLPTTTFGASTGGCCAQCIGWGTFNKGLCSNTIANVSSLDGCCITTTVPGTTPPITVGPPVSGITVTSSSIGQQSSSSTPPGQVVSSSTPTFSERPTPSQTTSSSNESVPETTTTRTDVGVASVNIIIIVVCVVGGCVLLFLFIVMSFCIRHRNKRRRREPLVPVDTEAIIPNGLDAGVGARSVMDPLGLYRQSSKMALIDDSMTPSPVCFPSETSPFGVVTVEGSLTRNGKVKFLTSCKDSINGAALSTDTAKYRPESGRYSVKNGLFLEEEMEGAGKGQPEGILLGIVGESYSDATLVRGLDLSLHQTTTIYSPEETVDSTTSEPDSHNVSFSTLTRNKLETAVSKVVGGKNIAGKEELEVGASTEGVINDAFDSEEEVVDDDAIMDGMNLDDMPLNIKFHEFVQNEFDNLEKAIAETDATINSNAHLNGTATSSMDSVSSTSENSTSDMTIQPSPGVFPPLNLKSFPTPPNRPSYAPKSVPESSTRSELKSGVAVAASNSNINKAARHGSYPTNSLQHVVKKNTQPARAGSISSPMTPVGDDADREAFSFPSPSTIKAQNRAAASAANGDALFGNRKQLTPAKSYSFGTPVLKTAASVTPASQTNSTSSPQKQSPKFQNKSSGSNKSPVLVNKSPQSPLKTLGDTSAAKPQPDLPSMPSLAQRRFIFANGTGPNRAMSSTDDNSSPSVTGGAVSRSNDELSDDQAAASVSTRKALFEQPIQSIEVKKFSPARQGVGARNDLNKA